MREYKREKAILEIQVAELEKKSGYHDDHLRIVDAWWNQVCAHIPLMFRAVHG
jgi:E3 ubiquitin-protein ligase BRE1